MTSLVFDTPSDADLMQAVVQRALRATGVSLPGTVESYDPATQTCTVRPGVHRLIPTLEDMDIDEVEELPALQCVPVCWPRGCGFSCVGTLAAGDPVLLICQDRDISGWRRTGHPAEPDDARIHHWGAAVAIPGLVPNSNPIPVPTDAAVLASKLDAFLRTVAALKDPTGPTDIGTAMADAQAIIVAARTLTGSSGAGDPGLLSTGSTVLRLGA